MQSLTVRELKDKLRERGLKVGGKKAQLIERLQQQDQQQPQQQAQPQPQQQPPQPRGGKKKEPKIKWKKSKARALLYADIKEGRVPLVAKDADGKPTMALKDIYALHPEFQDYDYGKFSSRVSGVRKIIQGCTNRAAADLAAFNNYKANHPPSVSSHKGYIQWQGSKARECLLEDIKEGKHKRLSRQELFGSNAEYYENFNLDVFREKLYQELRTAKYLHTIEVKGNDPRKKKDVRAVGSDT